MNNDLDKYFILDCNGMVCGNVKGYVSVRAAISIANRRNSKAFRHIWKATKDAVHTNPSHSLVYSVRSGESIFKGESHDY